MERDPNWEKVFASVGKPLVEYPLDRDIVEFRIELEFHYLVIQVSKLELEAYPDLYGNILTNMVRKMDESYK